MASCHRPLESVHRIASVCGELPPIHHFRRPAPRLRILACEAANANHGLPCSVSENDAHLEKHFQFVGNGLISAVDESLYAITALENKAPPFSGERDLLF
jgi:hypothetical protein